MIHEASGRALPATPKADHCRHKNATASSQKRSLKLVNEVAITKRQENFSDNLPEPIGNVLRESPASRRQQFILTQKAHCRIKHGLIHLLHKAILNTHNRLFNCFILMLWINAKGSPMEPLRHLARMPGLASQQRKSTDCQIAPFSALV